MKFKYRVGSNWRHVTAIQFSRANFDAIEEFVGGDAEFRAPALVVATPQGALRVRNNGWIVKYKDVFFAFSDETFRADFVHEGD